MTEQEFEQAKDIVWNNILTMTKKFDRLPTEAEFQAFVAKIRPIPSMLLSVEISDDDYEKVVRAVRANFTVQMEGEEAFIESGEHQKWLDSIKSNVDWFFWTRYEKYLRLDKNWSPALTAALNTTTDNILDFMGNPNSDENFSRRGLIIGEVQSGKTATYTALCAKAADVGYKVIIVLTGMLEDLRKQTQTRLDFEFAGRKSEDFLSKDAAIKNMPVGVAKYGHEKSIPQFTSVYSDFDSATLKRFSLDLKDLSNTVLFVVKKNKSVLENLIKWLEQSVKYGASKIDYSLLLLDDEADNASINTNDPDKDPTAINTCIRAILNLFRQTTYIGVTATPFANIFINPFDEAGMFSDDLFPRDFIYALDVPNNYIGAEKIFGNNDEYKNFLVPIQPDNFPDVEEIFPKRHKIILQVNKLPESLCEAINYFLLVNAIRDLRGDTKTHRTMLINVSGWKNVHEQTYDLVNARLQEIVIALRAYAALSVDEAEKNSAYIVALHKVFDKFKLEKLGGLSWEKILHDYLRKAVEPVKVGLRNSTGKNSFSYEQNPNGLRVIAIGGNSFSRGLTLEGLCVTYFYRNSRNYDTLMQMGRWFGYRPNYGDLCRLWTTQEIVNGYGYIAEVSNELKQEVALMKEFGRTPKDFGLKVRRHPDTLEITARNKIKAGRVIHWPVELNKIFIETPRLSNNAEILSANENLIREFVDGLNDFQRLEKNFWRDVPKKLVADLILKFRSVRWERKFQGQPLSEYIMNKMSDELWDVFIPSGASVQPYELTCCGEKFSFNPMAISVSVDDGEIQFGGTNRRVGNPTIPKAGLSKEQIQEAETKFHSIKGNEKKNVPENAYMIHGRRPLFVIYAVRPKTDAVNIPEILFALGVGFPALDAAIGESQIKTADFVFNAIGALDEDGDDD